MQVFSCTNPHHVYNKYVHDWITVPCGKCDCCKSKRALSWVDRLEIERKCHKYCLFFTLTYSDDFVPRFEVDPYLRALVNHRTGEYLSFNKLGLYKPENKDSLDYVLSRKYICYQDSKILQDFIKRLRSKVHYYEKDSQKEKIRYFIATEFGPTTHRVHHHGMLFFESSYLAANAKSVVASSWSTDNRTTGVSSVLGEIDVQFVDGSETSASNYVASYVNGACRLPKIYQSEPFAPKSLFSKCPAIGSLLPSSAELQELFNSGAVRISKQNVSTNTIDYCPLPSSLKDRLYPKIKGFCDFDTATLVKLYGLLSDGAFKGFFTYDYRSFVENIHLYLNSDSYKDKELVLYLDNLLMKESSVRRYYSVLNHFEHNRYMFGLSVKDYVVKIQDFYLRENAANLKDYFDFQVDYAKMYPIKNLIWLDCDFVRRLKESDHITYQDSLILKSFGYEDYSITNIQSLDMESNSEFVSVASKYAERINKSHKVKQKNEYLMHRNKESLSKIFVEK